MLRCQFLSYVLITIFLIKIALKLSYFWQKNAKFSSAGDSAPRPPCLRQLGASPPDPHWPLSAGGSAPRPPLASIGWGIRPHTPKLAPPLRISGYAPGAYDAAKVFF